MIEFGLLDGSVTLDRGFTNAMFHMGESLFCFTCIAVM
jgi:hypothetical protein